MNKTAGNISLGMIFLIYLLGTGSYCFPEQMAFKNVKGQELFSVVNLPIVVNLNEKDSSKGNSFRLDFISKLSFSQKSYNQLISEYCEVDFNDYFVDKSIPIYIWVDCFRVQPFFYFIKKILHAIFTNVIGLISGSRNLKP